MGSTFMRRVKGISLGQTIVQNEQVVIDLLGHTVTKRMKYVVTDIYPFFVKTRRVNGEGHFKTRCFNIGELVQLGYMPKGGCFE